MKRFTLLLVAIVVALELFGQDLPQQLPIVYITTSDSTPVVGREWHDNTKVRICRADGMTDYRSSRVQAKAHGNSSFHKPKKPLTLKLEAPASVLGMTPNRKWFFVSNLMDHSLLRNSLALTAARMTSMAWNSDWRLVNVVENRKYIGCYMIGEEIHAGKEWVDTDLCNGFLVELDNYPNDRNRFSTPYRQLPVNVRYPKEPTEEQMKAIIKIFNAVEGALYSDSAWNDLKPLYDKYLNLNSYVDYYIIFELCQNAEPNGPRSCYMYLGKDGRLNAGPVWDFDLAFESMGLDDGGDIRPERFHLKDVRNLTVDSLYDNHALWYDRLLKDKTFRKRLSKRWHKLKHYFLTLADSLDHWKAVIEPSANADQQMWHDDDPAKFDNTDSFQSSFTNLRKTLLRRIETLNKAFDM